MLKDVKMLCAKKKFRENFSTKKMSVGKGRPWVFSIFWFEYLLNLYVLTI